MTGYFALGLMVIGNATFGAFSKELSASTSPLTLIVLSECMIALVLILSCGLIPLLEHFWALKKKTMGPMLLTILTTGIIGPALWFQGLHYTTAVNAELFSKTEIVFLFLLSNIILHEGIRKEHIYAATCIAVGTSVIAFQGSTNGFSINFGDFLIILSRIAYAAGVVIIKKSLHTVPAEMIVFARSVSIMIIFMLAYPFVGSLVMDQLQAFSPSLIPALIGFVFLGRFLSVLGKYEAVERLPMKAVSQLLPVVTVLSILFSSWYLNEEMNMAHWIGSAIIIMGTVILGHVGTHKTREHDKHHFKLHHRHHHL